MFNFKLQSILDVRKTIEEKTITQFAEKQQELQHAENTFVSIQLQKKELLEGFRNLQGKKVSPFEIMMTTEGIHRCREDELTQHERVCDAQMQVDMKRGEVLEAVKQRKAMERLKDKHLDDYRTRIGLHERAAADEMVVVRHNRGQEK